MKVVISKKELENMFNAWAEKNNVLTKDNIFDYYVELDLATRDEVYDIHNDSQATLDELQIKMDNILNKLYDSDER